MRTEDDARRLLGRALLASLLLHLAFLAAWPAWRETRRLSPPAPIVARLAPLDRPGSSPAQPKETARREQAANPKTPVSRSKRTPPPEHVAEPVPVAEAANAAGTLARYRIAVIARARGLNRYPSLALANGWEGRSELRLRIAADGGIEAVDVLAGSGHDMLDRHAAEMIAQAAREVPIPEALSGRAFSIEIPVVFALRDSQG